MNERALWHHGHPITVDRWGLAVIAARHHNSAMDSLARGMSMPDMWSSLATHLRTAGLDDEDCVNLAYWILRRWGDGTGIDSDTDPTIQRLAREAIAKFTRPMPPIVPAAEALKDKRFTGVPLVVPSVAGANGAWHLRADGKKVRTR